MKSKSRKGFPSSLLVDDERHTRTSPHIRCRTHNGQQILEFMAANKIRGNFKNFVLFIGDRMLDVYGSYTVVRPNDAGTIVLLHKSRLENVLGEEIGRRFWNKRLRRRTNHGQPPPKAKK